MKPIFVKLGKDFVVRVDDIAQVWVPDWDDEDCAEQKEAGEKLILYSKTKEYHFWSEGQEADELIALFSDKEFWESIGATFVDATELMTKRRIEAEAKKSTTRTIEV